MHQKTSYTTYHVHNHKQLIRVLYGAAISLPWKPSQPTSKKGHIWLILEGVRDSLWGLLQFTYLRNSKIIMVSVFSHLESSWQLIPATDLTHNMFPVTFILVVKTAVCIEQGISQIQLSGINHTNPIKDYTSGTTI